MRKVGSLLIALCVVCCLIFTASAAKMEIQGIKGLSISEDRRIQIIKNLRLELVDNDNYKVGIYTFDVSQNGKIALATENGRIYVYDSNGDFLYGYYFQSQGAYGVTFAGENVAIYFVRGDFLAIYDPAGNCIDVQEIVSPTYPNNTPIFRRVSKLYQGRAHTLERDVEATDTYARLVITDEDGNRNIIYDISTQHSIGTVLMIVFIIGFFALAFWGVGKRVKEHDSHEGIWYCRELEMQISLNNPKDAFFMDHGEKIRCRSDLYFSDNTVEVLSQELEHPSYPFGKTILAGQIKQYTDVSMLVYDRKTCREYTFERTDKIG